MTLQDQVSMASWTMSYGGESFEDGGIGALELADALHGIQNLVGRCNALANGPEIVPALRIRSQPPASFEFLVDLSVPILSAPLIAGTPFTAELLKTFILGTRGAWGVLGLITALRGRMPRNFQQQDDSIVVEQDGRRTTVPLRIFEVATDRDVRISASGVFAPLRGNENNRLVIKDDTDEIFSMNGNDIDSFEYNDPETNGARDTELPVQILRVVALNLVNRNAQWRFNDGKRTNSYSILDEEFLNRVEGGGERFGKGDILVCRVLQSEYIGRNGQLSPKYSVIRVLEHQQPEVQEPLFEDTP